ncbi:hypothetical protein [Enterobacter cloacae complex sp. 2025EL-00064]|uniref:hypothetical protein n=1 Tax=Enterobacter cloacae complex sp. 2025EL-00064 TaxID=3415635 RepID=UPI003C76B729
MIKILAVLAALGAGWLAVDSYLSLSKAVDTLTENTRTLSNQLETSQRQHNAEAAVGLLGLRYSQQGTANQEKTKIEIRKEIIKEPCAGQPVPDASAGRLWQLATESRAAVLSGDARESDSVTPAASPGR